MTKLAHRTYAAASAIGVVAFSGEIPISRVNHLLLCLSLELTVSADILVCLALVGWTDNNTSLWEMEAVFEDVLCPLIDCPPAVLLRIAGEETKTSL